MYSTFSEIAILINTVAVYNCKCSLNIIILTCKTNIDKFCRCQQSLPYPPRWGISIDKFCQNNRRYVSILSQSIGRSVRWHHCSLLWNRLRSTLLSGPVRYVLPHLTTAGYNKAYTVSRSLGKGTSGSIWDGGRSCCWSFPSYHSRSTDLGTDIETSLLDQKSG